MSETTMGCYHETTVSCTPGPGVKRGRRMCASAALEILAGGNGLGLGSTEPRSGATAATKNTPGSSDWLSTRDAKGCLPPRFRGRLGCKSSAIYSWDFPAKRSTPTRGRTSRHLRAPNRGTKRLNRSLCRENCSGTVRNPQSKQWKTALRRSAGTGQSSLKPAVGEKKGLLTWLHDTVYC